LQQSLKQLMELQKLDTQLNQLEETRGDLPHQVRRLNQELDDANKELEENKEKLQSCRKERDLLDLEIKDLEGRKGKYQSQLFKVKTNREYDAVTQEIETVTANIEMKENRLLELMDLDTELKKTLEEESKVVEKLKEKLEVRSVELKKKMTATEKGEASLNHEREKIVHKLDNRLLATYERIRKAKSGFAVVPVIRNACGGCFKSLPPQKILEIRPMDKIYLCEVCGRIIVWDDAVSEQAE